MTSATGTTIGVDRAVAAGGHAHITRAMQRALRVRHARRVVAAISGGSAHVARGMAITHAEATRHAEGIELAHLRLRIQWTTAIRARGATRARIVLIGEVVTDVALGIAGVAAAIHGIGADADLRARVDLAMTVAGAGKPAFRVAAAAIRVRQAQITSDVAAARGLANRDAGRAGRAQAAAAIAATRAQHAVDFRAVRRPSRRGRARADGMARRDRAISGAAIRVARARVSGLNAERRAECADFVRPTQAGAAIAVVDAAVARSAAAVVERRANFVGTAGATATASVTRTAFAVRHALRARALA